MAVNHRRPGGGSQVTSRVPQFSSITLLLACLVAEPVGGRISSRAFHNLALFGSPTSNLWLPSEEPLCETLPSPPNFYSRFPANGGSLWRCKTAGCFVGIRLRVFWPSVVLSK
jgi:hypothetical protein